MTGKKEIEIDPYNLFMLSITIIFLGAVFAILVLEPKSWVAAILLGCPAYIIIGFYFWSKRK